MRLVYSPQARKDLLEIKSYIAVNLVSPQAAENVISRILKSCSNLKEFSSLGGELKNKFDVNTDMRYLVTSNYIIFYRCENDIVKIIRILDARTDYMQILFGQDNNETI